MKSFFKKIVVAILTWEARAVLRKYQPKIIAVTGSVGKTSTKDAIYAALHPEIKVHKNQKSFNSEIGTPLTILGLENAWGNPFKWCWNIIRGLGKIWGKEKYPDWLILEIGADRPNDIRRIAKWLKPQITVITRVPEISVHIENFPNGEAILEEKAQLLYGLSDDDVAILNADDERIMSLADKTKAKIVTFGKGETADWRLFHSQYIYDEDKVIGIKFVGKHGKEEFDFELRGVLGEQLVYPILIAAIVAEQFNISPNKLKEKFVKAKYPPGRMSLLEGINDSLIIDDSYNSSPVATEAALQALGQVQTTGRKIAVLGDMLELGQYAEMEHERMGALALANADCLITVGKLVGSTKHVWQTAGGAECQSFHKSKEAGEYLKNFVQAKDVILVKGSQGVRMERIVKDILVDKTQVDDKVVRQSREWLRKG